MHTLPGHLGEELPLGKGARERRPRGRRKGLFFFLMYKLLECKNFVSNDKTHNNFISICTTIHIITWYFLNGTVYLRLDPAEADLKVTCKFLQRQASQQVGGEADEVEQRDS